MGRRDSYPDNLKLVLIVMVVIGHMADIAIALPAFKSIYLFIYTFHMPVFIFVAGWFNPSPDRGRDIASKAFGYILVGYCLKALTYVLDMLLGKKSEWSFFSESEPPWFMFAMAAYLLLSYIFRRVRPEYVLCIFVVLACIAGYNEKIGDFLVISRIIVFYPFYMLGIIARKNMHIYKKTSVSVRLGACVRDKGKGVPLIGVRVAAVVWLLMLAYVCTTGLDKFYVYRGLLTGRNPYSPRLRDFGFARRLFCYVISVLTGGAVMALVPKRTIPLVTKTGARTLQIFFWHTLVLRAFKLSGAVSVFTDSAAGGIVYIMLAVLLTFLCAAPFLDFPTGYIMKIRLFGEQKYKSDKE